MIELNWDNIEERNIHTPRLPGQNMNDLESSLTDDFRYFDLSSVTKNGFKFDENACTLKDVTRRPCPVSVTSSYG